MHQQNILKSFYFYSMPLKAENDVEVNSGDIGSIEAKWCCLKHDFIVSKEKRLNKM